MPSMRTARKPRMDQPMGGTWPRALKGPKPTNIDCAVTRARCTTVGAPGTSAEHAGHRSMRQCDVPHRMCNSRRAFQNESYNYAFSTTHAICMCKCLHGLHALLAWQSGSKARRSASDTLGQNWIPGSAWATGRGAEIHRPLVAPPSEAHWLPRDPTGARGSCPSKPARRTFDQSACLGVAQWPFLPAEPQHPEGRHRGPKAAGHSAFGGFPCRGLQIRWRRW